MFSRILSGTGIRRGLGFALALLPILVPAFPVPGLGQPGAAPGDAASPPAAAPGTGSESLSFTAPFFSQYNPVTARDMVEQVPGFQIDEGGEARGFGGAAGNILINGERPSTKDDDAAAILSRIPAAQVARIVLIRGETGGLDLRGQTVVANVILRDDDFTSTRWEARIRTTAYTDTLNPEGSLSRTGRWRLTQYTAGLEAGEARSHRPRGFEYLLVDNMVAETRDETGDNERSSVGANINTETLFANGAVAHVNGRTGNERSDELEHSRRLAQTPGLPSRNLFEGSDSDTDTLELGGDYAFPFSDRFEAKLIGLFNRADTSGGTFLQIRDLSGGFLSASMAERETLEKEVIARLELDWSLADGDNLEFNLERTKNTLDNALALFEDTGAGLQEVPLPGANARVEEIRWDTEVNYSFRAGPVAVDAGLSLEDSTISQQGDAQNERSFSFLKPRLLLTYAETTGRQVRLRLEREVAQLDFNDFVSATNFGDNQFDLGNPELSPETTWVAEMTLEQRFGDIGAATVTAFHHRIDDVQDKLPLRDIFEIPGNIGNGRRWGVETALTLPLDRAGIAGGRIDLSGHWQDSSVEDPVTGRDRVLSDEAEYEFRMDFRHNPPGADFAWGGMVAVESEVPVFGLDEFVITDDVDETLDIDIYIETTRWRGIRTRLQFGNVLNRTFHRDRLVFTGQRELSPLAYRELRDRKRGHSIELSMTGVF